MMAFGHAVVKTRDLLKGRYLISSLNELLALIDCLFLAVLNFDVKINNVVDFDGPRHGVWLDVEMLGFRLSLKIKISDALLVQCEQTVCIELGDEL